MDYKTGLIQRIYTKNAIKCTQAWLKSQKIMLMSVSSQLLLIIVQLVPILVLNKILPIKDENKVC